MVIAEYAGTPGRRGARSERKRRIFIVRTHLRVSALTLSDTHTPCACLCLSVCVCACPSVCLPVPVSGDMVKVCKKETNRAFAFSFHSCLLSLLFTRPSLLLLHFILILILILILIIFILTGFTHRSSLLQPLSLPVKLYFCFYLLRYFLSPPPLLFFFLLFASPSSFASFLLFTSIPHQ